MGIQMNPTNSLALLKKTYLNSTAITMKVYEKPKVKDLGYYMIIGRNKIMQSLP